MYIYFNRIGASEYLLVTAEDRTPSDDRPRTYKATSKTFRGLQGLLNAAENAKINEDGLMDLNSFANQTAYTSAASSEEIAISSDELERMGFPMMKIEKRIYLVSIAKGDQENEVLVTARMQNVPPGFRIPQRTFSFRKEDLDESLKLVGRKISDLHDPGLGPNIPQAAKLDEEDLHTLITWNR